jgi:hypothetical protein
MGLSLANAYANGSCPDDSVIFIFASILSWFSFFFSFFSLSFFFFFFFFFLVVVVVVVVVVCYLLSEIGH